MSDCAGPLRDFPLDEIGKLLGRHRRCLEAKTAEPGFYVGPGEDCRDDIVELRHHGGRRSSGCHQTVPDAGFETRKHLGDRRNLGRERRAHRGRNAKTLHLAAPNLRYGYGEVTERKIQLPPSTSVIASGTPLYGTSRVL